MVIQMGLDYIKPGDARRTKCIQRVNKDIKCAHNGNYNDRRGEHPPQVTQPGLTG
jgi:hypothetical protein